MSFTVDYDLDNDCILVHVKGHFDPSVLHRIAEQVAVFVRVHHCLRVLNDLTQAKLTPGVADVYDMPTQAAKAGIENQLKRALLVKVVSPQIEFLETVFMNQGHLVKVFTDRNAALAWLRGEAVS